MPSALVIDDSRQMADSLCQMLSLLGVDGHPAYGPRAAFLLLREKIPDVVFLDINMPGVDGFEVLAYLRRVPALSEIPVIVVTSDEQPETVQRARRGGAIQVIVKPASLAVLENALKTARLIL